MSTHHANPLSNCDVCWPSKDHSTADSLPPDSSTRTSIPWVTNIDFIAHAFKGIGVDETPWVAGFQGDPKEVDPRRWLGASALPLPRYINDANNNYVSVSTFGKDKSGRFRRHSSCFVALRAVMVDDIGTKIPMEKIVLEPTCLVETSPGNYQAWYFLSEPERDRNRAEQLIRGLIASGLTTDGADPGMSGLTRYGRLPVGVNGKAKYHDSNGNPFNQTVAHWNPELRYRVDDIASAYDVNMTVSFGIRKRGPRYPSTQVTNAVDGFAKVLESAGLYLDEVSGIDGAHLIVCPWVHEHTDQDPTGTVYFEPSEENAMRGGFKCHHGHCQHRTIADLNHFVTRLLEIKNKEVK